MKGMIVTFLFNIKPEHREDLHEKNYFLTVRPIIGIWMKRSAKNGGMMMLKSLW